ncbi:uncharacterized protein AB675_6950 [Cyphellophora attinorum]|uniref:Uncharacterized protein n=1 Tax=Cyphellophora attinorum TaxID=1664694 RepID=A0A0N0NPZ0_9EURO|nr:uncharacterized protein AB675_6950 [Phialophora attinorum]KPI43298.1 hypothetical protein AB675_6950 [Phialophora attinorum]
MQKIDLGLNECFEICQSKGYHQDPDIHIGSAASRDVNPFSVLDHNLLAPPTPPKSDFTFTFPAPNSFATTASIFGPTTGSQSASAHPGRFDHSQKRVRPTITPVQQPPKAFNQSPPSSQVAVSSKSGEALKHQEQHHCPTLNDIRIPSPLLYHKESRQAFNLPDDSLEEERIQAFLRSCGQALPDPAIWSDQSATAKTGGTGIQSKSTPTVGHQDLSVLHSNDPPTEGAGELFRNVPEPPWTICSSIFNTQLARRGSSGQRPVPIETTSDIYRSSKEMRVTVYQRRLEDLWTPFTANASDASNPTSPSLDECMEMIDTGRPVQRDGSPASTPMDLIDDDPETIERMWDAFESTICGSDTDTMALARTAPPRSTIDRPRERLDSDATIIPEIDIAVCSAPDCTALVPASLYRQSVELQLDRPYNAVSFARKFAGADRCTLWPSPSSVGLSTWLKDLGIEQEHTPNCDMGKHESSAYRVVMNELLQSANRSNDANGNDEIANSAASFGLTSLFEEFEDTTAYAAPVTTNVKEMNVQTATSPSDADDDGYFSSHVSDDEIAHSEAAFSEVEWDFDWD